MRRSLRKIDTQEVVNYPEEEQLFTVLSLEEARQRLVHDTKDPAAHCFFTWMREGVRYYRVWEDKKLKEGVVRSVPFGSVAARLKRADAEKLYTVAKRFQPGATELAFEVEDGTIRIRNRNSQGLLAVVSLPQVGGELIMEDAGNDNGHCWSPSQAAHFLNVILARGQSPDQAFSEAIGL